MGIAGGTHNIHASFWNSPIVCQPSQLSLHTQELRLFKFPSAGRKAFKTIMRNSRVLVSSKVSHLPSPRSDFQMWLSSLGKIYSPGQRQIFSTSYLLPQYFGQIAFKTLAKPFCLFLICSRTSSTVPKFVPYHSSSKGSCLFDLRAKAV